MKNIFNFSDSEIQDIIESTKGIPQYEYKIKTYVDGFEGTGFLKGDKITFKLDIIRKNNENKNFGVLHSKCFPGLFKEFIYIMVINNKNIIRQEKIFIKKKENEFKFVINLGSVGIVKIKIMLMPGAYFVPNTVINCELKCFERSEKREEMLKNIEEKSKNEKMQPSLIQRLFHNYHDLSDDEDEEDDDDNNKKEQKSNIHESENNSQDIENNEIINNVEVNNEIENNDIENNQNENNKNV